MPVVPSKPFAFLVLFLAVVAAFVAWFPPVRWILLGADGLLLVLFLVDTLVAYRTISIQAVRQSRPILSIGTPNPIAIEIKNQSSIPVTCEVFDDPIYACVLGGLPTRLTLPPYASRLIRYQITPVRRGVQSFGSIGVRAFGLLGMCVRNLRFKQSQSFDIYPDIQAARELELLRRQGRKSLESGSLRVRGGQTEFEQLRGYVRGDDLRHIDWRASARRGDLIVRQFRTESNQNVMFVVDAGRSMRGTDDPENILSISSIDRAINAVILLANVVVKSGDRVGLMIFDSEPRSFVPPAQGRSATSAITRALYALDAGLEPADYREAVRFLSLRQKSRSLVILFTQLLDPRAAKELIFAMKTLAPRHLPLCVPLKETAIENLAVQPAHMVSDLYVRAAAAEILEQRERNISDLQRAGVMVLDVAQENLTEALVSAYLEVKTRRLL